MRRIVIYGNNLRVNDSGLPPLKPIKCTIQQLQSAIMYKLSPAEVSSEQTYCIDDRSGCTKHAVLKSLRTADVSGM